MSKRLQLSEYFSDRNAVSDVTYEMNTCSLK